MNVSFIVICFNGQDTIANCFRSLVGVVNVFDFEVIFVDDGSDDGSVSVATDWAKNFDFIKVFQNEENLGRSASRNVGLENARGDYVFFLDADDSVFSPAAAMVLQVLCEHDFDFLVTSRIDVESGGSSEMYFSPNNTIYRGFTQFEGLSDLPSMIEDNFVTGKFFSRRFLEDNCLRFDLERRNAEDIVFTSAAYMAARYVGYCDKCFYIYQKGGYKRNFSLTKFCDVLVNLSKTLSLGACDSSFKKNLAREKYLRLLHENIKRAHGILNQDEILAGLSQFAVSFEFDNECFSATPLFLRSQYLETVNFLLDKKYEEIVDLALHVPKSISNELGVFKDAAHSSRMVFDLQNSLSETLRKLKRRNVELSEVKNKLRERNRELEAAREKLRQRNEEIELLRAGAKSALDDGVVGYDP